MKSRKILAMSLAVMTLCTALAGCGTEDAKTEEREAIICGNQEVNEPEKEAIAYYVQNNEAMESGTRPPELQYKYCSSLNNMLMDLNARNIDFFWTSQCVGNYLQAQDDSLQLVEDISSYRYHMATRLEDGELREMLDHAIETLRENGTLDELTQTYITDAAGYPMVQPQTQTTSGETYVVGVTGDLPPLDYITADGKPTGFNAALLGAIAEQTGCNFKLVQVEANARVTALAAHKIDIIFWNCCIVTEDYQPDNEVVALSVPYYEEKDCAVTRDYPVEKIQEIFGLK